MSQTDWPCPAICRYLRTTRNIPDLFLSWVAFNLTQTESDPLSPTESRR